MYKLTTIDIEKIDCPILIRKVAGTDSTHSTDGNHSTQEYRFINGAELVASSFEEKYDIKTVRICSEPSSSQDCCSSDGSIEILVSKPECEQPISRNKDDSFF